MARVKRADHYPIVTVVKKDGKLTIVQIYNINEFIALNNSSYTILGKLDTSDEITKHIVTLTILRHKKELNKFNFYVAYEEAFNKFFEFGISYETIEAIFNHYVSIFPDESHVNFEGNIRSGFYNYFYDGILGNYNKESYYDSVFRYIHAVYDYFSDKLSNSTK